MFRVTCLVFLFLTNVVIGQDGSRERLLEIASKQRDEYQLRKARIAEAEKLQIPSMIKLAEDKLAVLFDYRDGLPYYFSTHNLQARKTTEVDMVQNLNPGLQSLFGKKITIGVWDGGLVRRTHQEFQTNRVSNKSGGQTSNHATHVMGTILACGVTDRAKGMVPQAKAFAYYAFDDDLGPMAQQAAAGLVLSNHSYGLLLGWEFENRDWKWYGGSTNVDRRFGHYSGESKSLDDIAYNAPYYTIVRSAGNDRSDTGDGTRPPDGAFDCLGPAAVAKNVISVGAITGFDQFGGGGSISMSSFSSWGPTNDGRIKPDIVADGVGVYTPTSSPDDACTVLQGTSMAAPNVTGSLAVLQGYYRESADTFMTSAALKAVMIHTAREAGTAEGPDYRFGWGVLNVADGFEVLKNRNGSDTLLVQAELPDGGQQEYFLFSDGKSPITATIAWTDVSGPLGSTSSTSPKLVNDLDIRLVDNEGAEVKPWVLDPSLPTKKAAQADNIRDNVEKIEFPNPVAGLYTLRVSHKSSLVNGKQAYGLVLTGSGINAAEDIYWVHGSGDIDGVNWSLISGGTTDSGIDSNDKTWVFDDNAALMDNDVITISGNTTIKNLVWINDSKAIIDLGGDTLFIDHELFVQNAALKIRNGVIVVRSMDARSIAVNFDGRENCTVVMNNGSPVEIAEDIKLSGLVIKGNVEITSQKLIVDELHIKNGGFFNASKSELTVNTKLNVGHEEGIQGSDNYWKFGNSEITVIGKAVLDQDSALFLGPSRLIGNIHFEKVRVVSTITVNGEFESEYFAIGPGGGILMDDALLTIYSGFTMNNAASQRTVIKALSANSPGVVAIGFRKLLCLDFIDMENLIFETESVINFGANSTLTNVTGVFNTACESIIFPDFKGGTFCSNTVIPIENLSIGDIDEYLWDFGNGEFATGINDVRNPNVVFDEPGVYPVSLTVKREDIEIPFEREIEIVSNDIPPISIVQVENELAASITVAQYLWYLNGVLLVDETGRRITPKVPGAYRVGFSQPATACASRVSEPFQVDVVTSVREKFLPESRGIDIYPNPVSNVLFLSDIQKDDHIAIMDVSGRMLLDGASLQNAGKAQLDISKLPPGMLILSVTRGATVYRYKIIKK